MKVVGVDEAGRGAWAGPLVAAAVFLSSELPNLADSKVLTPKKRVALYKIITTQAEFAIGQVSNSEIDANGISWAQTESMSRALSGLSLAVDEIIVDGSIDYLNLPNSKAVIDADAKYPSVMAASIVAKVYRDRLMEEMDIASPGYGFAAHKGYGTKFHSQALKTLGISPIHRISYKPIAARL